MENGAFDVKEDAKFVSSSDSTTISSCSSLYIPVPDFKHHHTERGTQQTLSLRLPNQTNKPKHLTISELVVNRPRSQSTSDLTKDEVPEQIKSGVSSLSLNPLARKSHYLPVDHSVNGAINGTPNKTPNGVSQPEVQSFADFIEVRNPNKNTNIGKPRRKMRRRLVYKNGDCNVTHKHISKIRRHYLADVFTTLVDLQWRWTLIIFILAFLFTWVLFAAIWYTIAYFHGDVHPDLSKRPKTPCFNNVHDFTSAFLFSVETQHTIGYGSRYITEQCPEGVVILLIQSITGVLVQALMTGMCFAKLSRPKNRAETLMFSKNAVICQRDGELCLMFRIGDMRSSHLIESHIRGMCVRRRVSKEGEVLPLDHQDLDFGLDTGTDRLLIIWPVIVIHKINKSSPFWRMSKADLKKENFEIIIVLEGVIESTGMTTQARTSYLPGEILWGHRLERLVTFQKEGGEYQVDYARFENTVPVDTPAESAKELAAAMNPQDSSSSESETEFTLMRNDSIQTSETDEEDILLVPDGSTAISMSKVKKNSASGDM